MNPMMWTFAHGWRHLRVGGWLPLWETPKLGRLIWVTKGWSPMWGTYKLKELAWRVEGSEL